MQLDIVGLLETDLYASAYVVYLNLSNLIISDHPLGNATCEGHVSACLIVVLTSSIELD